MKVHPDPRTLRRLHEIEEKLREHEEHLIALEARVRARLKEEADAARR